MRKVTLFHDGCGVCLGISETFVGLFDPAEVTFESVDLGRNRARLDEAEATGVTELPALVIDGRVLPIEPHSDLEHLKPHRKAAG